MPDREVPGSARCPDPGASRLDAVERLRRQLDQIESRSRGDNQGNEQWSKPVRTSGGSRRRRKPGAADASGGVWRSDSGPLSDEDDNLGTAGIEPGAGTDHMRGAGESVRPDRRSSAPRTDGDHRRGAITSVPPTDAVRDRPVPRGGDRGSRRRSGSDGETPSRRTQSAPPQAGTEAQAKDVCLRLLTDRARSRAELADKLAAKGFAPAVAERTLDRLAEVGLINDAAFAEQWVHSRHTFSGKGKKVLAQELRRKGVADTDAEPALAAITPADESARAAELVRRKLTTLPGDMTADKATARLVGMLARRGYNQSMAYAVVKDELATATDRTAESLPEDLSSRGEPATARTSGSVSASAGSRSTQEPDVEQAAELVRRKVRTLPRDLPRDKATVRLVGMLARRGYRQPTAYAVVKDELAAMAQTSVTEQDSMRSVGERAGRTAEANPDSADSGGGDVGAAAELVRRKMRTMPRNLSTDKVINRLVGTLARRGYRQSVAYDVVRAELAHGFPPD